MFIAMRLPLVISAKSEMLSISLFAEEVRKPPVFYKHYVPTARFCPGSIERLLLRQKLSGASTLPINCSRAQSSPHSIVDQPTSSPASICCFAKKAGRGVGIADCQHRFTIFVFFDRPRH